MKKAFKMMAAVLLTVLTAAPFGGFAPSAEAAQTAKPVVKSQTYKHVKQLTYPEVTNTGNASFEKKINQDFKRYIENSYKEYVKNKKDGEKQGYKAEYQADFKVKYNQGGKLSIQTENYSYTGGAHGLTAVQTFNYDLAAKNGSHSMMCSIQKRKPTKRETIFTATSRNMTICLTRTSKNKRSSSITKDLSSLRKTALPLCSDNMISDRTRQESGTFSCLHPSINKKAISLQNGAVSLFSLPDKQSDNRRAQ